MNILTDFGTQIAKLFESMTPSARIMAGLMVGVIVVSLGWIFTAQQSTNHQYLFGGRDFSDAELDSMEAAFSDAGLREFDRVGKRIKVPADQKDIYLKSLSAAEALPKEWGGYTEQALGNPNPFASNFSVAKEIEFAKERDVASVIKMIPTIEFASVDYDEQRTGFARNTLRTCSVSVRARNNSAVAPETLKLIARHVQGHFAGLTEENLTVTDLGGGQSYRGSGDPLGTTDHPYLQAQKAYERDYEEKVARVLSNYGDVHLAVNVELDPRMTEESERLQYDPTAVTVETTESRKDQENTKPAPAGQPGAASNGVANQPQSINSNVAGPTSNSKQSEAKERRVLGHEALVTRTAGLVPKKVTISVGIPESYYIKVAQYRAMRDSPDAQDPPAPPTAAELAALKTEVEQSVRAAVEGMPVGIREGDDRLPYIKVYSYTDLPLPELPGPSFADTATGFLAESWSTLALLAVVLVSLGMTFSWIRSQKPGEADAEFADGFGLDIPSLADELSLSSAGGDGLEGDGETEEGRRKPAFDLTGGEIKDDLSSLIKENPDAAVNLLKAWIGDAM